jgi:hypothetical protein
MYSVAWRIFPEKKKKKKKKKKNRSATKLGEDTYVRLSEPLGYDVVYTIRHASAWRGALSMSHYDSISIRSVSAQHFFNAAIL